MPTNRSLRGIRRASHVLRIQWIRQRLYGKCLQSNPGGWLGYARTATRVSGIRLDQRQSAGGAGPVLRKWVGNCGACGDPVSSDAMAHQASGTHKSTPGPNDWTTTHPVAYLTARAADHGRPKRRPHHTGSSTSTAVNGGAQQQRWNSSAIVSASGDSTSHWPYSSPAAVLLPRPDTFGGDHSPYPHLYAVTISCHSSRNCQAHSAESQCFGCGPGPMVGLAVGGDRCRLDPAVLLRLLWACGQRRRSPGFGFRQGPERRRWH